MIPSLMLDFNSSTMQFDIFSKVLKPQFVSAWHLHAELKEVWTTGKHK